MSHRDDLLDAARTLILEQGYARTTARELVATSGTNLASIGYHFGSKDALLQLAMSELAAEWAEQLTGAALAVEGAGPLERLTVGWERMLESFDAHRPLGQAWLEALALSAHNDELRAAMAAHYQRTREVIAGAIRSLLGEDAAEQGADPEVIASFLIAVCDGLLTQFLLDPARRPSGEALAGALGTAVGMGLRRSAAA